MTKQDDTKPLWDSTQTTVPQHAQPLPSITNFKLIDTLGEGGFGIVYLAEQAKPIKRRVAVKVIKPGMDSKAVLARFEAERQALAMMNHPNVAKVFDAGTTDRGQPYFVMELVTGVSITEHCDRHKLNIVERLNLFVEVCEAVQHAHQKGIIHRDIKPSNILVEYRNDKSICKVIDFGVAKAIDQRLTEQTIFTQQDQIIGTPAYMSPEQAEMTAQDIDTRSDIYSLGVVLYQLLTGVTPFDTKTLLRAGWEEIRRVIRELEPQKPSTKLSSIGSEQDVDSVTIARNRKTSPGSLSKHLRGDLDWVTIKALEKDRTRRYATATELADDIRRHLHDEPVLASPPSSGYRFKKFIRRNKGPVTAVTVVLVTLAIGLTATTYGFLEASQQRVIALERQREAERARDDVVSARNDLQDALAKEEKSRLIAQHQTDLLRFAAYRDRIQRANFAIQDNRKRDAAKLLDECAVEERDWEWHDIRWRLNPFICSFKIYAFAEGEVVLSPGLRYVAFYGSAELAVGELSTCEVIKRWEPSSLVQRLIFTKDVSALQFCNDERIERLDLVTGAFVTSQDHGSNYCRGLPKYEGLRGEIPSFSKQEIDSLLEREIASQDGSWVARGYREGSVRVARSEEADRAGVTTLVTDYLTPVISVAIRADEAGSAVASMDFNGQVKVAKAWQDELSLVLVPDGPSVGGIAFDHTGELLAIGNAAGDTRIYSTTSGVRKYEFAKQDGWILDLVFAGQSHTLAAAGNAGALLAELGSSYKRRIHDGPCRAIAFSPSGNLLLLGLPNGVLRMWDVEADKLVSEIAAHESAIYAVEWAPNGDYCVSGAGDGTVKVWSPMLDGPVATLGGHLQDVNDIAISRDAKMVATASDDESVILWNASTWEQTATLRADCGHVHAVTFSPNGRRVFTGGTDGLIRIWDTHHAKEVIALEGHKGAVLALAFSPNGRILASGGTLGKVRLWDTAPSFSAK